MLRLMAVKSERAEKSETVLHFARYNGQKYLIRSEALGTGRIVEVAGKVVRIRNSWLLEKNELANEKNGEEGAVIRMLKRPPSIIFSKDSELSKPDALESSLWDAVLGAPQERGLELALLLAPSNYFYTVLAKPEGKISGEIMECRMAAPPAHVFFEENRLRISMIL